MLDAQKHEIALGDQIRTNIGLTGVIAMLSWNSDYVKVVLDGSTEHVWLCCDTVTIKPNQQPES